jgi:hypothetical protein
VGDYEILHVQAELAAVGVLLDVQEIGAIVRENGRDVRGHRCITTQRARPVGSP